jgi:hypothetical protein
MGGRNPLVGVVHNAQHAQGASARVHGGGERVFKYNAERPRNFPSPSLYFPVEDDDDEEEEEDDGAGRFWRRCWLCGMPRCTDR